LRKNQTANKGVITTGFGERKSPIQQKKSTGFPVPFSSKSLKTKTALFECEKN